MPLSISTCHWLIHNSVTRELQPLFLIRYSIKLSYRFPGDIDLWLCSTNFSFTCNFKCTFSKILSKITSVLVAAASTLRDSLD
jgi:hypothetical protein